MTQPEPIPEVPFATVAPPDPKPHSIHSWRNPLIIAFSVSLIFATLFLLGRFFHNDFLIAAEPTYQALLKVKADFESPTVTDAQRSTDLHQAGRLVSQFKVSFAPTARDPHGPSSMALENALNCYRDADAERGTGSAGSLDIKLRGDKYLAEARKNLDGER